MKKLTISGVLFFLVILIYILVPIHVINAKINEEQHTMHHFIAYEQQFSALNQKNLSLHQHAINKQEDDRYQIQELSRTTLLLNFEGASYALNQTLQQLQQHYPFLAPTIRSFNQWKSRAEKQLLEGRHLLYWQGPLLSGQLQMMQLINNPNSEKNWSVEKTIEQLRQKVSKLTTEQQCQILSQFGKTQSPHLISEQLAILNNHPPTCSMKEGSYHE